LLHADLTWLVSRSWRWRHVPPKHRWTFNGLYGIGFKSRPGYRIFLIGSFGSAW
jgi:hypothetical protein